MLSVSLSDARAQLPALLTRVEEGEDVTITRHGRPVAVLVSPRRLHRPEADEAYALAAQLRRAVVDATRSPIPSAGLTPDEADALVAEVRAGRDRS